MDPAMTEPEKIALHRARLHVRAGRRRLRQGKISAGLVTIYDAFLHGMEWVMLRRKRDPAFPYRPGMALGRDQEVFDYLQRQGQTGGFDYEVFNRLIEKALSEEMAGFDYAPILEKVEGVLAGFGVLPFDEAALPPEDPQTF